MSEQLVYDGVSSRQKEVGAYERNAQQIEQEGAAIDLLSPALSRALLNSSGISQRGNSSARATAMLQTQQSQGNQAVQRAIQRQSDEEARRRRQPPAPPHTLDEPALPPLLNWDGSIHQPPAHTPGGGALPPIDRDWGGPGRQGGPGAPDLSDLPIERNWDGPSSLGPAVSLTAAPLPPIDRVWDEPLPPIDRVW